MASVRIRFKSIVCIIAGVCLSLAVGAPVVNADGGTLHVSERRSDRTISVFTDAMPLRVGSVDVSVLVQSTDSGATIPDASINVNAYPVLNREHGTSVAATSAAATNKLFQAAHLEFSEPGQWHVEVAVQGANSEPPIGFDVEVLGPLPHWVKLGAWIVWPLLPIALFAVHQVLVHRRRKSIVHMVE